MDTIDEKRMAAELDGGFVIYINGMRLNKLRASHKWIIAGRKMAKMLDRLEADSDSGFFGYRPAFMGLRTGAAIQYWRSLEDLKRVASDPNDLHVPAWKWYNEEVESGGRVGFWAELYVIGNDDFETFFRNMHHFYGVGKIADIIPMSEHQGRLGPSEDWEATPRTDLKGALMGREDRR